MVSSTTAVGGTLRCVTLATKDNLALEKWTSFLEKVVCIAARMAPFWGGSSSHQRHLACLMSTPELSFKT